MKRKYFMTDKCREAKKRYDAYCAAILEAKEAGEEFYGHIVEDIGQDMDNFTTLGCLMSDIDVAEVDRETGEIVLEGNDFATNLDAMIADGYITEVDDRP